MNPWFAFGRRRAFAWVGWIAVLLLLGCSALDSGPPGSKGSGGSSGSFGDGSAGASGAAGAESAGGSAGSGGAAGASGSAGTAGSDAGDGLCPTQFVFTPPAGTTVSSVNVAGEWNNFDKTGSPMSGPNANGAYTTTVDLPPGLWAYKLVLDGSNWELDPSQGYRKYVGGIENSAVEVPDCALPSLVVVSHKTERNGAGSGHFTASLRYVPPISGAPLDPTSVSATVRHGVTTSPLAASDLIVSAQAGTIGVDVPNLADGKYTIKVSAKDKSGRGMAEPLRLVFWIEATPYNWHDALIYMIVTDRFRDADKTNDAPPTPGVTDAREDWKGGDLEGVRQTIADGYFDKLGVRALWLTPFQTQPAGPYLASDNTHLVTGYHGYWPIKAREVEPRIGTADQLKALVAEAHQHGIRVLMDFVVNHVHQEHEYAKAHPSWFRTSCICGTNNCDWDSHRITCQFAPYLLDVNWTNPEAAAQFVSDAVWWIDTFDLDGLRIDAVKHVEELAITNLSTKIHAEFDQAGNHTFLTGETAMGWSDCGSVACNASQYDLINEYIGPHKLDGQFDFVLYHAVAYRVFAYDQHGFIHADFWTKASLSQYPNGSIMTPFIGSHDTARLTTLATYRGQPGYDQSVPFNEWTNLAGPPPDMEPYYRQETALSWLLTLPGAPLLYYGDEYGQWGGVDPGNRAMWRGESGQLTAGEQMVLARTQKLGTTRQKLEALRRGDYETLDVTEQFLSFARVAPDGKYAIVALSRDPNPETHQVTLPASLGIANGAALKDYLGGSGVTVSGGAVNVALPGWGAAIYAP